MKDKFLWSYRIAPRPAFIRYLSERLEMGKKKSFGMGSMRLSPVALGVITLVLAFSLTFAISPVVRAQVENWVGQVGGVLFTATVDYPGGEEPVTDTPSDTMSLEDASALLPFAIDLPTRIPEGYVLDETVTLLKFEDNVERVFIQWTAPQEALLELQIENQTPNESKWIVGQGSVEEVLVNGMAAALVRGGWQSETQQWSNPQILHLYFPHNGQTYILSSFEKDIPVDELILIAESLP